MDALRRLAELPRPVRYVLLALALVVAACVLHWIDQPDDKLVELHVRSRVPIGAPLFTHPSSPELASWRVIRVPASQVDRAVAEYDDAFVAPVMALPSAGDDGESCPITTPRYDHLQGYLSAAPEGIDAGAAWRRGARGAGVWFADIEGGWNASHEDLPGDRITLVHGRPMTLPGWREHGTAVLGEVVGIDNGRGVTGIAPDVDRVLTSSIGGSESADAIDAAAQQLRAGDVLLIELQGYGPRGKFVPVEYWDDELDAIKAATARGVVVIEAAGNGNANLDDKIYRGKFDRHVRDSGAIMVGAGGPPREGFVDRARLDFSNYGSRVDAQGWGRRVATLDYGDLQRCDDTAHRHYTDAFSGTSSASPIVAGAAVLLESYAKRTLSPAVVRQLLTNGSPQTGDTREHIGPRPDLAKILSAIETPATRSR
ncbi:MAG TPA: S8 family serine peptidase [Kofleriaceae bacterium]|jgi:subtilisin family serine protease|nr:S8 family serine peptidase [Kofleriaceae bacterium]